MIYTNDLSLVLTVPVVCDNDKIHLKTETKKFSDPKKALNHLLMTYLRSKTLN